MTHTGVFGMQGIQDKLTSEIDPEVRQGIVNKFKNIIK